MHGLTLVATLAVTRLRQLKAAPGTGQLCAAGPWDWVPAACLPALLLPNPPAPAALPHCSLYTLRVELYSGAEDRARLAAEVLLTAAVFVQLLLQLWQIAAARWASQPFPPGALPSPGCVR